MSKIWLWAYPEFYNYFSSDGFKTRMARMSWNVQMIKKKSNVGEPIRYSECSTVKVPFKQIKFFLKLIKELQFT